MSVKKEKKQGEQEGEVIPPFFEDVEAEEEVVLPQKTEQNLQKQVDDLKQALLATQEKAEQHWKQLQYTSAEMKNQERRLQEEIKKARLFAMERFAQEALGVMDSLEQGLAFAQNGQASVEQLKEGFTLTQSAMKKALENQGITLIEIKQGDLFDPHFHEALSLQGTEEVEPNRILVVVQQGYMLHNRLLRPARVIVSKALEK